MGEEGADGHGDIGVGGIAHWNVPIGPDALVQINDALLPEDHGGHAYGDLADGGRADLVVRRHGHGIPDRPAAGEGVRNDPVLHHGHLHTHGPVLRRHGLHLLLDFLVAGPAGALRPPGFQLRGQGLGQGLLAVIGGEGNQRLGQLAPGDGELRVDGIRRHAGELPSAF